MRHARAVLHRHRLVHQAVDAPRRAQRVGELAADLRDLRHRQERRHRQQGEQGQHGRIDRTLPHQQRAGDHDGEAAEAGEDLEQAALQGQLAIERQAQLHVPLRQGIERTRAVLLLLEGDDLAEALHRIDREGAELAGRFARLGAEPVDLAAQQERAQPDRRQERQQRQRQPGRFDAQPHQHHARHQDGDEGGRDGVGEEILDQLDVMGGERHQVAGAPPHQIGRRQLVQLAEHVDAHVRQQAERHVVRDPGFQPMQQAGQRRHDRERPQPVPVGLAVLEVEHHQGAQDADADEGHHAQHAEQEGGGQAALPAHHQLHQRRDQLQPVQALGLDDAFGHAASGRHRGCAQPSPAPPTSAGAASMTGSAAASCACSAISCA